MHNPLGFSLYLSTFAAQWPPLRGTAGAGTPVFLSLHISEEFDDTYCARATALCHSLADRGCRIIADVSRKTLTQFACPDLIALARELRLWALRIDFGFSPQEILELARQMPIVLNASTVTAEDARHIAAESDQVFAMHNFYPRPETGLDDDYLLQSTQALQSAGLKVLAFIAGDAEKRGPVFEGLPTLEAHRSCLPSAAFADLTLRFGMDGVFLADPGITAQELERIDRFCQTGVLSIPARLEPGYVHLYGQVFTCRPDSPKRLIRFLESRVYSCPGQTVTARNCIPRCRGSITLDNEGYGRYSGELQLIRQDLPADDRVNVIGNVLPEAMPLADLVAGGARFMLVQP